MSKHYMKKTTMAGLVLLLFLVHVAASDMRVPTGTRQDQPATLSETRYGSEHFTDRIVLPNETWEVIHDDFYTNYYDGQANYGQVAYWWNWTATASLHFSFTNETGFVFYNIYSDQDYNVSKFPASDRELWQPPTSQFEPILSFHNNGSSPVNVTGFVERYTEGPTIIFLEEEGNNDRFITNAEWTLNETREWFNIYNVPFYPPPYTNQTAGGVLNFTFSLSSRFDQFPPSQMTGTFDTVWIEDGVHEYMTNITHGSFWNGTDFHWSINTTSWSVSEVWVCFSFGANLAGLVGNGASVKRWLYVNNDFNGTVPPSPPIIVPAVEVYESWVSDNRTDVGDFVAIEFRLRWNDTLEDFTPWDGVPILNDGSSMDYKFDGWWIGYVQEDSVMAKTFYVGSIDYWGTHENVTDELILLNLVNVTIVWDAIEIDHIQVITNETVNNITQGNQLMLEADIIGSSIVFGLGLILVFYAYRRTLEKKRAEQWEKRFGANGHSLKITTSIAG